MTGEGGEAEATRSPGLVLAVLLLAQTMATMDGSIVAVASNTVRADLHTSDAAIQFVLAGYTMAFSLFIVTGAKLGRDIGFRRIFRIGITGFTAASLMCAVAPNAGILIAGRALEGAFGAMLVPQVLSLIQILFSGPARARAIGVYSMILSLGVAIGQIVGGLVVGANVAGLTWRAAFYINIPIGLFLMFYSRLLPGKSEGEKFTPDAAGMTLLAVSMIATTTPLIFGRQEHWPVWSLVTLPLGLIGLALFFVFESRLADSGGQPLLEVQGLRPPGVRPGLLAACILNFGFAGIVLPLTLHLQGDLNYTPLRAGLAFVPMPIGFATVSMTWTKLPERFHNILPMAGLILFAAAVGGLALVADNNGAYPALAVCLLFAGAGMALGFSTIVEQTAEAVGKKYASALSAMVSMGTLLASIFAVAIIGGIYFSATGSNPANGGHGLGVALGANAGVLLVGVALAARVWLVTRGISGGGDGEQAAVSADADAEPKPA